MTQPRSPRRTLLSAAPAAARDAAWAALAPTAATLQDSAIGLYRAMISPGGAS